MSLWLIPAIHEFRNFPAKNVNRVRSPGSHSANTYRFLLARRFQIYNLQSKIYNLKCPALSSAF